MEKEILPILLLILLRGRKKERGRNLLLQTNLTSKEVFKLITKADGRGKGIIDNHLSDEVGGGGGGKGKRKVAND